MRLHYLLIQKQNVSDMRKIQTNDQVVRQSFEDNSKSVRRYLQLLDLIYTSKLKGFTNWIAFYIIIDSVIYNTGNSTTLNHCTHLFII